jgi:hypothetical protein
LCQRTPAESNAAFVLTVVAVLLFLLSPFAMLVAMVGAVVGSVANFAQAAILLRLRSVPLVALLFRVMALHLCRLLAAPLLPRSELSPAIETRVTKMKLLSSLFQNDRQTTRETVAKRDQFPSSGPNGLSARAVATVQGTSQSGHVQSIYVCYNLFLAASWSQEHTPDMQTDGNGTWED